MFVVRECGQGGEVRHVVIAENEGVVRTLVVIGIRVALSAVLNIDKLSKMQDGAVQEVDIPSDETDVGAAFVIGHTGGMDSARARDEGVYLPEVVFDQWSWTLWRACCWALRR
jgi:sporulation protein YlmC with PRC-barrel domain